MKSGWGSGRGAWKKGGTSQGGVSPVKFALVVLGHGLLWTFLLKKLYGSSQVVHGPSMCPTLEDGDRILVKNLSLSRLRKRPLRPGEVAMFRAPTLDLKRTLLTKRVIFSDKYPPRFTQALLRAATPLPPNHLWVEGDNKMKSYDSRDMGPISAALVQAKAVAIIWPPRHWRLFP